MATTYWDYWDDAPTTSSSTTTTSGTYTTSGTTSATDVYWLYTVRKYLVKAPESWMKSARADFTKLINDETKTGFKVEMWIDGIIEITDHSIDMRTMKEFVPLLKSYANLEDRAKIDAFFERYDAE